MAQWKDDEIDVIKDDIERLRTKPQLFISYKGKKGVLHIVKEAVNNGIDECVNPFSPCDRIDLEVDENTNTFTITDNGRGIQVDRIVELCTYLQAGSNLHKEEGNRKDKVRKAGDHGVGLTAITAFAETMTIVSYQLSKMVKGTFTFKDGKNVHSSIMPYKDKHKHGTTISFKLDKQWLGSDAIDVKGLKEWLREESYTIPSNLKLTLTVIPKGSEVGVTEKFKAPNGILDKLATLVNDPVFKPIRISKSFNEGDFLDFAVTYSATDISDFTLKASYCNWVETVDGGEHIDAFEYAWCQTVSRMVNKALTEKEKKTLKITFEDCRQGLAAVVNLICLFPGFTGQTKQKVGNDELYKPLVKLMQHEIGEYFKKNQTDSKRLIQHIKATAKARMQLKKAKVVNAKVLGSLDTIDLKGWYPCESTDRSKCEVFISEGESAGGQIVANRNPKYQAVFMSKGNPMNGFGKPIDKVLENEELKKFYHVGEAGIGKNFNIAKFRFAKVILFVDSDIDAYNMMSLWGADLIYLSPEIVTSGRLYRSQAPLYILNNKKHPYALSKHEYFGLFADNVVKHIGLIDCHGHKLSNKEVKELIAKNNSYYSEIQSLQKYVFVPGEVLEVIILNEGKNLVKGVKAVFPETDYNSDMNILNVNYNGNRYRVRLTDNFFNKLKRLRNMITETNHGEIYYDMMDGGVEYKKCTLGSFFKHTSKYMPEVINRIKGVGELPPHVIWETVLNPETRQLIQLTAEDINRELEICRILHGNDSNLRKEFMKGYVLDKDDLDT